MELVDVIEQGRESIVAAMEAIALYLTIVTAYIVTAHTTGSTLSRFQVFFVTVLFVVFSLFFTLGSYLFFIGADRIYASGVLEDYIGVNQTYAYWIAIAELLGIVGSLIFMYQAYRK